MRAFIISDEAREAGKGEPIERRERSVGPREEEKLQPDHAEGCGMNARRMCVQGLYVCVCVGGKECPYPFESRR